MMSRVIVNAVFLLVSLALLSGAILTSFLRLSSPDVASNSECLTFYASAAMIYIAGLVSWILFFKRIRMIKRLESVFILAVLVVYVLLVLYFVFHLPISGCY